MVSLPDIEDTPAGGYDATGAAIAHNWRGTCKVTSRVTGTDDFWGPWLTSYSLN